MQETFFSFLADTGACVEGHDVEIFQMLQASSLLPPDQGDQNLKGTLTIKSGVLTSTKSITSKFFFASCVGWLGRSRKAFTQ